MSDPKPGKVVSASGKVYHKSSSASATEAPTNEFTKQNATKQGSLTLEQLDFVTIVAYHWGLDGALPDKDFLVSNYHYKPNEVAENYTHAAVKQALEERGIELREKATTPLGLGLVPSNKPQPKLTPLQLIVANSLLDLTDTRSEKKKLNDLGVSTTTYQSWLRDPDFQHYIRERTENLVGDLQHEALLSLMDGVRAGNIKAIQYYHEFTGRFTPASAQGSNSASNLDVNTIIIRIIEILNDEIEDPQVASRIANKLKGLVMGGQIVAAINEPPPVVVPEIAKPRAVTPEVQELMDRGTGYDS